MKNGSTKTCRQENAYSHKYAIQLSQDHFTNVYVFSLDLKHSNNEAICPTLWDPQKRMISLGMVSAYIGVVYSYGVGV